MPTRKQEIQIVKSVMAIAIYRRKNALRKAAKEALETLQTRKLHGLYDPKGIRYFMAVTKGYPAFMNNEEFINEIKNWPLDDAIKGRLPVRLHKVLNKAGQGFDEWKARQTDNELSPSELQARVDVLEQLVDYLPDREANIMRKFADNLKKGWRLTQRQVNLIRKLIYDARLGRRAMGLFNTKNNPALAAKMIRTSSLKRTILRFASQNSKFRRLLIEQLQNG